MISAVLATVLVLCIAFVLPFGTAQVNAATPTPQHTYQLTATTQTGVLDQLALHYQDAISRQYDCFAVETSSAASEEYLYARFDDSRILMNLFVDQFNLPRFDYEAGIRQTVTYYLEGVDLPAGAKTLTITVGWRESPADRELVRAHVRSFLNGTSYPRTGTDEQKLTAINTYIGNTFAYDQTTNNSSAAAMLISRRGVCTAYSLYGYAMLSEAGYSVRLVLPRVAIDASLYTPYAYPNGLSGAKGAHAWLLVQVGANWYHMDFTWNDPIGGSVNKDYYMRTDSQIRTDHKWKWNDGSIYNPAAKYAYYPAASVVWTGVMVSPTPSPSPKPTKTPTPIPTPKPTPKVTMNPTSSPTPISSPTPLAAVSAEATPSTPEEASPSNGPTPYETVSIDPTPLPTNHENSLATTPVPTELAESARIATLASVMIFGQRALAALHASWQESPVATAAVASGSLAALLLLVLLASRALKRRRNR
jgi:hypothetical protein